MLRHYQFATITVVAFACAALAQTEATFVYVESFRKGPTHITESASEVVLTPQGAAAVELAVDRCEQWRSLEELTTLLRRNGRP